ncbi:hypothetical protein PILCRDRAFT_271067 [Piloderma croceum F 1598]|uniref:SWIM-type domain-containing protein n=1 Tax=Piloderma croceum (strain F 1598) TaxID=765440 RepID=A0A0C3BLG0_PILCF|nr:hypothetical protein PILCRDRAFT_271067 [Piloderma croceum F 1598]
MARLLDLKAKTAFRHSEASPRAKRPSSTRLTMLKTMHRNPEQGWVLLEQGVHGYDLPEWFETQRNDFNIKEYHETSSFRQIWLDTPGDRPKDIRARRFAGEIHPLCDPQIRRHLLSFCIPIFRATFNCAEACCRDMEVEREDEAFERQRNSPSILSSASTDIDSEQDVSDSEPKSKLPRKRTTNATRTCKVLLHVEITADKPDEVKIWQKGVHRDADSDALAWSLRLRRLATEDLSTLGGTASKVQKKFTKLFSDEDGWNVPSYRRPSARDIENIFPAFRRRERLAKNSFEALSLFAQKNRDRVYLYSAHAPRATPPTRLACAATDNWSKDSAILHSRKSGVGFDSSYRNKNENFALVTLLTTVNDSGCMVPIATCISEDIQMTTLVQFLTQTKVVIEARAEQIHQGMAVIEDRTTEEIANIKKEAARIVRTGWVPGHFMIDKSLAEKRAIQRVWAGAIICVCQFHIIQAILRWVEEKGCGESGKLSKKTGKQPKKAVDRTGKPSLPTAAMKEVLEAFRWAQRCRNTPNDRWHQAQVIFEGSLQRICHSHNCAESFATILKYFRDNWWCDEWRDLCTDIGLPQGQTRDGTFNTNNWTESAYRTFDVVFLENRKNKRIDRLMSILVNDFLPHYRFWSHDEARPSKDHIRVTRQGHDLWSADNVIRRRSQPNHYKVYYIDADKKSRYHTVDYAQSSCTCTQFGLRGKYCMHLWAVHWFESNGPVHEWDREYQLITAGVDHKY